jgi:predicted adenylyl cyclase CyaB
MAKHNIEIEIHVRIEKAAALMAFLKKEGQFQSEKQQIDEYFTPAHRDFLKVRPITEWLRLRQADAKYSITYKNWKTDADGKTYSCDEYETTLGDLQQLRNILLALDLKPIVTVDKLRSTWTYKDYEIAIDSVKKLGDYVELEYIGADAHAVPKTVTKEMVQLLKKIGCGTISRDYQGYPFELLFPKEVVREIQ